MTNSLSKLQIQKIEAEWAEQKEKLLACVQENFGEIESAIVRGQRERARKLAKKTLTRNQHIEELEIVRGEVIRAFVQSKGFFSKQSKGVQNAVLLKRSETLVKTRLAILNRQCKQRGFDLSGAPTDGHDFEFWVAKSLEIFGWTAEVTVGSGDQGIDVIATIQDRKLAVQCKRYSGTVGNKAVQEAYAGMNFYKADAAAVITNSRFTRSAEMLAESTGVLLCATESIPTLAQKFLGAVNQKCVSN